MNKRLIEHLRQQGYIDELQLRSALARQQQFGGDLIDLLVRLKILSEREISRGLASFYRYPMVDLNQSTPDDEALTLIDGDYARKHGILPLQVDHTARMVDVAVFDPARTLDALDFVRRRAGLEPRPHITPPTALTQAINYFYYGELPEHSGQHEAGSASSASRPIPAEARGRGFSGSPRAALRSNRRSRRFDRAHDAFGVGGDPSSGARVPAEEGLGLGAHSDPLGASVGKIGGVASPVGSLPEPIGLDGFGEARSYGDEVPSYGGPTSGSSMTALGSVGAPAVPMPAEVLALEQRLEQLEGELAHEKRLVQSLLDILVETGLASRENLVSRLRDEGDDA